MNLKGSHARLGLIVTALVEAVEMWVTQYMIPKETRWVRSRRNGIHASGSKIAISLKSHFL